MSVRLNIWEKIAFDLRFHTENITDSPGFIAVLLVSLTDRVDVVDAEDPFVLSELDLAAEVVEMSYQRAEDFSVSGLRLWRHKTNDIVCKVGVEFRGIVAGSTVDSHDWRVLDFCRDNRRLFLFCGRIVN